MQNNSVAATDRDRHTYTGFIRGANLQSAWIPIRLYLVHLIACGCPKAVGGQGGLRGEALSTHTALMLEQPCAKVCAVRLLEAASKTNVALWRIAPCRQSLHCNTKWKPSTAGRLPWICWLTVLPLSKALYLTIRLPESVQPKNRKKK